MKKIVILSILLVALTGLFSLDLSVGSGYAFKEDGVNTHSAANFGFTMVEYKEITSIVNFMGETTLEEAQAMVDPYDGNDYEYSFNVEGVTTNANDIYSDVSGYFQIGVGTFVDNTSFGDSNSNIYNDSGNGVMFQYFFDVKAELVFYGDNDAMYSMIFASGGDNHTYNWGNVLFGQAPNNPGHVEVPVPDDNPATLPIEDYDIPGVGTITGDVTVTPPDAGGYTVTIDTYTEAQNGGLPLAENIEFTYVIQITGPTTPGTVFNFVMPYIGTPTDEVVWFNGTEWAEVNMPSWDDPIAGYVSFSITIPAGRNQTIEVGFNNGNSTLPVVLSSYDFSYNTEEHTVNFTWETSSETELTNYVIRRGLSTEESSIIETIKPQGTNSSGAIYNFVDSAVNELEYETTYYYWLIANNDDGTTNDLVSFNVTTGSKPDDTPDYFDTTSLSNYPNPFNPSTKIKFDVKGTEGEAVNVKLDVYNVLGQKVKNIKVDQVAGHQEIEWQGTDNNSNPVGSGVYFYKLQTDNEVITNKMILLK